MKYLYILFHALLAICANMRENVVIKNKAHFSNERIAHGDSKDELKEFRKFTRSFFKAIKSNDTIFLKAHVVFPIVNSALAEDTILPRVKSINKKYFFKYLNILFPKELIDNILKDGEYHLYYSADGHRHGTVTLLYSVANGVYATYNWIFIIKNRSYYFETFTAEA